MIGSDDVLACFIAGNVFTWDDWFRLETEDDSLQPTIDMLLNVSIFMWYGAVCPWHKFVSNDQIHIFRLVPLGIMVLLFRRLPIVLAYHHFRLIHQIEEIRHALFVGFFGPIGVSAIFYLYISREFLKEIVVSQHERRDAERLSEIIEVVVWFLVVCSIVAHGLSIPLGKLGLYLPRTITSALSTERISAPQSRARNQDQEPSTNEPGMDGEAHMLPAYRGRPSGRASDSPLAGPRPITWIPRSIVTAGRHIWNDIKRPQGHMSHVARENKKKSDSNDSSSGENGDAHPEISSPMDARPIGHAIGTSPSPVDAQAMGMRQAEEGDVRTSDSSSLVDSGATTPGSTGRPFRSIQFADQLPSSGGAEARNPG